MTEEENMNRFHKILCNTADEFGISISFTFSKKDAESIRTGSHYQDGEDALPKEDKCAMAVAITKLSSKQLIASLGIHDGLQTSKDACLEAASDLMTDMESAGVMQYVKLDKRDLTPEQIEALKGLGSIIHADEIPDVLKDILPNKPQD